MKVLINNKAGGFSLSVAAYEWLQNNRNWKATRYCDIEEKNTEYDIITNMGLLTGKTTYNFNKYSKEEFRCNKDVIECFEALGSKAFSGSSCKARLIKIPNDVDWIICEDDSGCEWVAEKHRTWGDD